MTDYNTHIHIPSDFFTKTLKEYQNWHFAWFRETAQNAADAGATQIDFTITEHKNFIKLIVQDNGRGLNKNSLIKGLLTLGGSIKQNTRNKNTIGGFGYAKHIILFAHQQYQITTRDLTATGSGTHYTIEQNKEFLEGTQITVQIIKTVTLSVLKQYCRQLIRNYQTDIQFTLNSKAIRTSFSEYDFDFKTELGRLQFSEEAGSNDVSFWIRVHGLPMFRYNILNRGQKGYIGTLDLYGDPTDLLTTNRDGLNHEASEELELLIFELVDQPHWFKDQHELKIIFNPNNEQLDDPMNDISEVLPFTVPRKLAMKKQLIAVINQLQNYDLVITYPHHFYLYITPILLRREHYQPNQITLPAVKQSLNLKRTQTLAWCWYYAVHWVLSTDFVESCLDIEFDTDNDRHIIHESKNEHLIVNTGFIFNEEIQGLNIRCNKEIKILLNPDYLGIDWLISDVLDVAIHECTHCIVINHGEDFNEVELLIRRDLRRTIDEELILADAKATLKPIQMSHFDYESYIEARKQFSLDEWINVLMQSIGFNPEYFGRRNKLMQLVRLIPFCERNYNLIELGPKGTGKSHIYTEFSPHGILISGAEVTVPKLFVNNNSGKIGLVGYWDTVAFDEFAGKKKKVNKALVDIMKGYMANKSFSRGVETLGADASMVFVGNTEHSLPYMLKQSHLFDSLPEDFCDSAFLDRLHAYIPGCEVDIIRGEMFSNDYGFVVDYLAEILRHLRNQDFSDRYKDHFTLSTDISTRDRDGINKTFSGLMKILFPQGGASSEEVEEILKLSMEGRKRVKDQLFRIDTTYEDVDFSYSPVEPGGRGQSKPVRTLEEIEYPNYFHQTVSSGDSDDETDSATDEAEQSTINTQTEPELKEHHLTFMENQRGVSYDGLFGPYLKGAKHITITDPYIRLYYQARNLMELLETIVKLKAEDEEIVVSLITVEDEFKGDQQLEFFEQMQNSMFSVGIKFAWSYDNSGAQHARHIVTDTGWKISLDRGLDIFQQYDMNDSFQLGNRIQSQRACKAFEVTYIKCEQI